MNIQIETVTTASGKMDVIRDIEKVKKLIRLAEAAQDYKDYNDADSYLEFVIALDAVRLKN